MVRLCLMAKSSVFGRGFTLLGRRHLSLACQKFDKVPVVAAKEPYMSSLVTGTRYSWCSCGLSVKQPFCDGSHKKTGLRPVRLTAAETCDVFFCGCKQTKTPPYCDGTHMTDAVQKCIVGERISC